ncbi:MAG: type VI secretion system protein TssA [Kiritimatiellaeota bacterium]|nr:type VI secretion system protein TssA [Kiritimatiellota bacterium]
MDIEKLTTPLNDEVPGGEDLSYAPAYLELEGLIYTNPESGDDNSNEPDWRVVRDKSLELFERSRDLRVATYLALSELELNGLKGLRDGIKVICSLICGMWDNVHPQLDPDDDNDPMERLNILSSLSPDAASYQDSMMFVQRLRSAVLCDAPQLGKFSHRDIMIATGELEPLDASEHVDSNLLRAAFMDTPIDLLNENSAAVNEMLDALVEISDFLTSKLGAGNSISFLRLEDELKSIKKWLNEYLSQRGGGDVEDETVNNTESAEEGGGEVSSVAGDSSVMRPVAPVSAIDSVDTVSSRADILRALDKICEYYDRNEPASPVPLILRRAQKLVTMSFYEILEDIAPDSIGQAEQVLGARLQGVSEQKDGESEEEEDS